MTTKSTKSKSQETRFRQAQRTLEKMQEQIAPFVKHKPLKTESSTGRWSDTSTLVSEQVDGSSCLN